MRKNIFSMMLIFACICSSEAAETKSAALTQKKETLTQVILFTKSEKRVFYSAKDEVAREEQDTKELAGEQTHSLGYRILKISPEKIDETLADPLLRYKRVFYRSSMRNERNRYIATGNIVVQLTSAISPHEYAAQQHLVFLRPVNSRLGIYLFSTGRYEDVIGLSNRLNRANTAVHIEPEWIRPVLLR
ncbi:MAG: hypothetical protein PHO65_07390 [Sulfurovum sp.]|nr:hypothetical protein [Sulfurovum sp.]